MTEVRRPDPDTILVISVLAILVSLCCLGPTLMTDLISLTTNPDEMPSVMCFPPPAWAILVMVVRELVFVLAAGSSVFFLARLARQGKFWRAVLLWGLPVAAFVLLVLLAAMGLPTPLQETPVCTGPANQPAFGYPYAWVMHPGQWTTYVDPYGFEYHSFSTYALLVNIVFLANLAICVIGGIALIRKERTEVIP